MGPRAPDLAFCRHEAAFHIGAPSWLGLTYTRCLEKHFGDLYMRNPVYIIYIELVVFCDFYRQFYQITPLLDTAYIQLIFCLCLPVCLTYC